MYNMNFNDNIFTIIKKYDGNGISVKLLNNDTNKLNGMLRIVDIVTDNDEKLTYHTENVFNYKDFNGFQQQVDYNSDWKITHRFVLHLKDRNRGHIFSYTIGHDDDVTEHIKKHLSEMLKII